MVQVASLDIMEQLNSAGPDGQSVDLSVQISADGTLQCSARHKSLDVNLTVEMAAGPPLESAMIDLTDSLVPEKEEVAPQAVSIEPIFETGLVARNHAGHWLISEVLTDAPVFGNKLVFYFGQVPVFYEIVAVDGVTNICETFSPALLSGSFGEEKKITIKSFLNETTITLPCRIPIKRDAQFFSERIAAAVIEGSDASLVSRLLDFARHSMANDYDFAMQLGKRAESISEKLPNDNLRIQSLCTVIRAKIQKVPQTLDVPKLIEEIIAVITICNNNSSAWTVFDTRVTMDLFDMASSLKLLEGLFAELAQLKRQLLHFALKIGTVQNIPRSGIAIIMDELI